MCASKYDFGRAHENKVARSLRGNGAKVTLSPASRGAADLTATFSSGKKWRVQVKSSNGENAASPSPKDLGRLKASATKSRATPVVAKSTPRGISYQSARSGRTLKP